MSDFSLCVLKNITTFGDDNLYTFWLIEITTELFVQKNPWSTSLTQSGLSTMGFEITSKFLQVNQSNPDQQKAEGQLFAIDLRQFFYKPPFL